MPPADTTTPAGERPPTVIYIHGIGNKPPAADHKLQWDVALFGRDMGDRTRMAYWADIRHPQAVRAGAGRALTAEMLAEPPPATTADFVADVKRAVPADARAQRFAERVARRVLRRDAAVRRAAEERADVRILPVEWVRRWVTRALTKLFIQDAAAYFYDADQHARIQERLRVLLTPDGSPYVVLAHSLGSVIAYDVLRTLAADDAAVRADLLLTFGSPLGIEEVQDNVVKPLEVPGRVRRWRNFADFFDPVALDKTLGDEYAPAGTIEDQEVVNRDRLSLSGFDPHSWVGYLGTEEIHGAVQEAVGPLGGGLLAPVVIAPAAGRRRPPRRAGAGPRRKGGASPRRRAAGKR